MSCLPNTPVAPNLLSPSNGSDYGWVDLSTITTNALSQYWPISNAIVSFNNLAQTTNQHLIIRQLELEEIATIGANLRSAALRIYLWNNTAPSSPTLGAVYDPVLTNLVAMIDVATADYRRANETTVRATVKPNQYIRTSQNATPNLFYATIVLNQATGVTYSSGATMRLNITTEAGTAI